MGFKAPYSKMGTDETDIFFRHREGLDFSKR